MARNILLVENDPDEMEVYAEFLRRNGYITYEASSVEEAQAILDEKLIHLAILDLRLRDDTSEADKSGLNLARQIPRGVSTLIHTKFPTHQDVRHAMRLDREGAVPVVDFVDKLTGLEGLLAAVEDAFLTHIRANWNLSIEWKTTDRYSVATSIETLTERSRIMERAEEVDDLFRRLFHDKDQATVVRQLWKHTGRVALSVFTFKQNTVQEAFVVVCGPRETIAKELANYETISPRAVGGTGTTLSAHAETAHLGANAYILVGVQDLETVSSIRELYTNQPERIFLTSVTSALRATMSVEYQKQRVIVEDQSLRSLYLERLDIHSDMIDQSLISDRINNLVRLAPSIAVTIERIHGKLIFRFGGHAYSYSDPSAFLENRLEISAPVVAMRTSGTLSGENILADGTGRTWLTDFGMAGLAPTVWNYATLESAIRYDWVSTQQWGTLHEFEECLLSGEFTRLDIWSVSAELRKAVKAIQIIRRTAYENIGEDVVAYSIGMLFHTCSRLVQHNPHVLLTRNELSRFLHILLSLSMTVQKLREEQQNHLSNLSLDVAGIRLDERERKVWVDGKRVPIRGQGYDLLSYLYAHQGQLCTRRMITEAVFGELYDERDYTQINRLNTTIRRLRERIEGDPEHPRYLLTELGQGYRLVALAKKG